MNRKTTRRLVACAAWTLLASISVRGALRVPSHADIWMLKRVGAPVPSPDGKYVVFSVVEPAYDPKEQSSHLWLKAVADDSPPRQLTFGKGPESGVAWSGDSARIAFSAKRDGDDAAQIYVMPIAGGGESQRVTSLALGARLPKWSPDGQSLLFVSEAYPGALDEAANKKAAKEEKERKYHVRSFETFPVRYWDHWLDEKKPHLFVQSARANVPARDLLAGSSLAAARGFGGRQEDTGEILEGEWTPAGNEIVFIASRDRDLSARAETSTQIFAVALGGGEPRLLTNDHRRYGDLKFTADGKSLVCTLSEIDGAVYNVNRLAVYSWPLAGAAPRVLTAALDRSVVRFALPTGDRAWFTCEESGLERLFSVPLAGGEVRESPAPAAGVVTGLAAGGVMLVGNWDTAVHPAEIYAFPADGSAPRLLTHFTEAAAAQLDLPPLEHFWFTSSRGKQIHNMVVRPPNFDPAKKYPLFVVVHGGAANMWRDSFGLRWNYHLLAAPGYVLLLTDYTGSSGYGEKFGQEILRDPLRGPANEINEAADQALRKYAFLDGSRQAAAGASYGGHLVNWLQATTTRYKCIISHAGEMDLMMQWGTSDGIYGREVNSGGPVWGDSPVWRDQSPVLQAGNHDKGTGFVTPILISVGERDFRVPMNNSLMNFATQQRLQVPSKLLVFPDENHWILLAEDNRFWLGEVQAWLARWLK